MEPLALYLEKFKKFAPPESAARQAVIDCVEELTGETLTLESVQVRSGTVFIAAHPATKTELFLRKEEILQCIKGKFLKAQVKDVR